jgi:hypothetical protein
MRNIVSRKIISRYPYAAGKGSVVKTIRRPRTATRSGLLCPREAGAK